MGFISITVQAGDDPFDGYPDGTFPVSFFTIIGDYDYTSEVCDIPQIIVDLLTLHTDYAKSAFGDYALGNLRIIGSSHACEFADRNDGKYIQPSYKQFRCGMNNTFLLNRS